MLIERGKRALKLGEILLNYGFLTETELKLALEEQARTGEKLGEILLRLGLVTEEEISYAIAHQAGVEFVNLEEVIINPAVLKLVPYKVARENKVVPIDTDGKSITIAIQDPFNFKAIDTIEQITGLRVIVKVAREEQILKAIENLYGLHVSSDEDFEANIREAIRIQQLGAEVAPIANIVNLIVLKGIQLDATDIHIEPSDKVTRIRYRVDGVLHPIYTIPRRLHPSIVTRIKIMSNLDIGEQRIPQDGGFNFQLGMKNINIRVSTYPTPYGESVVLRILERTNIILGLEKLGLSEEKLTRIRNLIRKPFGIIIVCGPTGSGKTTTLNSILLELNSLEKNIMTIEDPIEYRLPLIKQSQVNEKAGFTFASALRSILRHDPDVILVGEMRDRETAELAFQASLTGHLVLTTIHANTALQAIPRLLNLGVDPYIMSVGLIAIVGQRLVRRVCENCKEQRPVDIDLVKKFGLEKYITEGEMEYAGKGCSSCFHTTYRGRTGIFEILEITEDVRELIQRGAPLHEIESAVKYETMLEDGTRKVKQGITNLSEVLRVIG
ncbi:MAG: GspE/PulE family protein [bacterium]|nr:GspE/PulE family protein [bacterium]